MWSRFFYFGSAFEKNSDLLLNEFCLVRLEKTQFGLDIIVIYYSCNRSMSS